MNEFKAKLQASRQGTVLTFNNILKRDHFPQHITSSSQPPPSNNPHPPTTSANGSTSIGSSNTASNLPRDSSALFPASVGESPGMLSGWIDGAPNFRSAGTFNIYGVSQPSIPGLQTIVRLLLSSNTQCSNRIFWFNTREEPVIYIHGSPYVLRDRDMPKRNIHHLYAGISSDRLELLEDRLKVEILKEAASVDGFILIHDELHDGTITEQLVHVSRDAVKTLRDVISELSNSQLEYIRVPISPNQRPEDLHLDTFTRVIGGTASLNDALVFNCGFGAARTTFVMVVACLIRESLIKRFSMSSIGELSSEYSSRMGSVVLGQSPPQSLHPLVDGSISIDNPLESISVKQSNITPLKPVAATASSNYTKLLTLLQVIESGLSPESGSAVQFAMERQHLLNSLIKALNGEYSIISSLLSVLDYRNTKHVVDQAIDKCEHVLNLRHEILVSRIRYFCTKSDEHLVKSVGYLERYFFLLCFASYIFNHHHSNSRTSEGGAMTFSSWFSGRHEILNMLNRLRRATNRLFLFRPVEELSNLKSELDENVVRERDGSVLGSHVILKNDRWLLPSEVKVLVGQLKIEGAPNFRRIATMPLYATAQPTISALQEITGFISKSFDKLVWINLREEPLCYINGSPYVLRDRYIRIRNLKSYAGISEHRLDILEQKLKLDVVSESEYYDGMVLVHEESIGVIRPTWIKVVDVKTLKETYVGRPGLSYRRVPVTSEAPFELTDFDEILKIVSDKKGAAFVLNCQMGIGRSTAGSVIVALILAWLYPEKWRPVISSYTNGEQDTTSQNGKEKSSEINYHIIHSLIRSLKRGVECKSFVDKAVEMCAQHINLRKCIHEYKLKADSAQTKHQTTELITKGLNALQRYFMLIAFQGYLESQPSGGDNIRPAESFKDWFSSHGELVNMLKDLNQSSLVPLGVMDKEEIIQVVNSRRGAVLAQNMILKFDHFPGCQKKGMQVLINGAPNFRGVPVPSSRVYGVAMPTKSAIRELLDYAVGEDDCGTLVWTSLREEPVIYIRGQPYVLRSREDPFKNIETTGIERTRVERMEATMKQDVLNELEQYGGRVMLHEEEGGSNGFRIVPVWETVEPADVETPAEVFENIKQEGYGIEYLRIPVTDEQSPIPHVFDLLIQQVSKVATSNSFALFNCQMGRGRTSTGMTVACVLMDVLSVAAAVSVPSDQTSGTGQLSILIEELLDSKSFLLAYMRDKQSSLIKTSGEQGSEADEKKRLQRGDFKIVMRLLRVLQHGRQAKRLIDAAIDYCSHIQNIREAIYDYKIRYEQHRATILPQLPRVSSNNALNNTGSTAVASNPSPSRRRTVSTSEPGNTAGWNAFTDEDFVYEFNEESSELSAMYDVALNYLVRYFYLITFAGYVLEWQQAAITGTKPQNSLDNSGSRGSFPVFSEWLSQRREIVTILEGSNYGLD